MRISHSFTIAILLGSSLAAQVPPGSAVVLSATGFSLVDAAGVAQSITGLDPATNDTWALAVDHEGVLFAGLDADNSSGASPIPLTVRKIVLSGPVATRDVTFTTLMNVPPGERWAVMDLKTRADGSLLVGCTRLFTVASSTNAAFVVSPGGASSPLPTTGYPNGSLQGIADAGDRYVAVFYVGSPVAHVELISFPYTTGPGPFVVFSRASTRGCGGLQVDADGSIIYVMPPPLGAIARIEHTYHGLATLVPGVPANFWFGDPIPASGMIAGLDALGNLMFVDTLAGGTTSWGTGALSAPIAIAIRHDPAVYSDPLAPVPPPPYLGSYGGNPRLGHAGFGLRIGGAAGANAFVLLGSQATSLPTPYGTLLVDPLGPLVTLGPTAVPPDGPASIALAIPNAPTLLGGTFRVQGVLTTASPAAVQATQGLVITIL